MPSPFKTPAGEILALRLPKDAVKITISYTGLGLTSCLNYIYGRYSQTIDLPEGNWKILGPISHKGEFGFDANPFVEKEYVKGINTGSGLWFYMDYVTKEYSNLGSKSSFLSLIESQGEILWSNPMGEKPSIKGLEYTHWAKTESYRDDLQKWQSYEDKRVKETEQAIVLERI